MPKNGDLTVAFSEGAPLHNDVCWVNTRRTNALPQRWRKANGTRPHNSSSRRLNDNSSITAPNVADAPYSKVRRWREERERRDG
jgi:hypothetical protein